MHTCTLHAHTLLTLHTAATDLSNLALYRKVHQRVHMLRPTTDQVREKQLEVTAAEEQVFKLEGMLKDAKCTTDKVQKECNALSERVRDPPRMAARVCIILCSSITALMDGIHNVGLLS